MKLKNFKVRFNPALERAGDEASNSRVVARESTIPDHRLPRELDDAVKLWSGQTTYEESSKILERNHYEDREARRQAQRPAEVSFSVSTPRNERP